LTEPVLKASAFRWFLLGFALSGRGFHGEVCPPDRKAVRALLAAEFNRRWAADDLGRKPVAIVNRRHT
jgi:hypothetical protein